MKKFVLLFWVLTFGWIVTSHAQDLIVETGEISVPILNENFVQAKEHAIRTVKQQIIKKMLEQWLRPSAQSLQTLLTSQFIEKPDLFIASTRILQAGLIAEGREFFLHLEAKIFRSQFESSIKRFALPLGNTALRRKNITLLYESSSAYWQANRFAHTLTTIKKYLNAYDIHVSQFQPLTTEQTKELRYSQNPLFTSIQPQNPEQVFVLLDFLPLQSPKNKIHLRATVSLYDPQNGSLLSRVGTSQVYSDKDQKLQVERLIDKLSLEWAPLISNLQEYHQGMSTPIRLRISGLETPSQETQFVQKVFQNNALWKDVQLSQITMNSIEYRGRFLGEEDQLLASLEQRFQNRFQVYDLSWEEEDLIEFRVSWNEETHSLIKYTPVRQVEKWLAQQENSSEIPPYSKILLLPPSTVKSIYSLPANVMVYDVIKSRGDSTTYLIEWASSTTDIELQWIAIEKTNLQPSLTLYDATFSPLQQHQLLRTQKNSITYAVPQGTTKIYLRVKDFIGYLAESRRSFQSIHYLLYVTPAP